MDTTTIKKTVRSAAIFTVAPAISIVIAILSLSQSLGLPLLWLRLSVIGLLSYEAIAAANAIKDTWQGCIVTPYLMVQCSDSRHYGAISDKVYRFSAMALTSEERATIHGNDEKIRLEMIEKSVEFFLRLLRQC